MLFRSLNGETTESRVQSDDNFKGAASATIMDGAADLIMTKISDNAGGWASGTPTQYTFQKSGRYFVRVEVGVTKNTSTAFSLFVRKAPATGGFVELDTAASGVQAVTGNVLPLKVSFIHDFDEGDSLYSYCGSDNSDAIAIAAPNVLHSIVITPV